MFRLLYSTGMRTTEARLLRVIDVDLPHAVINIRKSKNSIEHYVALHPSMAALLKDMATPPKRPCLEGNCISLIRMEQHHLHPICSHGNSIKYGIQ